MLAVSRCKETSGILIARPCPHEAVRTCARTGMPICDACTRWVGKEPVSISALKAETADRRRRGEPIGRELAHDMYFYSLASGHFSAEDYALFESGQRSLERDAGYLEGDWEGS